MLFEGRRYWPRRLREFFVQCQERRKNRLAQIVAARPTERAYLEAAIELGLYPIDKGGEVKVTAPTRLGNILDSFEEYPEVKYGLDAIFFWYRLWVVIDKALREEIDNAQSVVDSALYIAFALSTSGFVMFVYAIIGLAPQINWPDLFGLGASLAHIQLPYVPAPGVLCGLGMACLAGGFVIYRLSLPAHAQFGELFKALFDQYHTKLAFNDVLEEIGTIMGDSSLSSRSQCERNRIVWRYLRWHRIRDDSAGKNYTVGDWRKRQASREAKRAVPGPHE
jgi:hypothetical protein